VNIEAEFSIVTSFCTSKTLQTIFDPQRC